MLAIGCIVAIPIVHFPWGGRSEAKAGAAVVIDFNNMKAGLSPVGFSPAVTGEGGPSRWFIEAPDRESGLTNAVVQRSAISANNRFPLCIYDGFVGKDVELSVRFKPISGVIDQAAGLVWRYMDANNYYVVRANALENNIVLYKMENGRRSDLKPVGSWLFAYGKDASVPHNQWRTLRVVVTGSKFSVSLNNKDLFDVEDHTFERAGKIGLWTKADSITSFDDLTIVALDRE